MIRGIHHFTVHVRDFERMKRFYMEAFGFTDPGFAGGWENSPEIDEIVDVPNSAARSAMLNGYTHFCVDVTGIEAEVERLTTLGMTFDRPHGKGRPVDVGIVKAIYGKDPEGNLIEIQETLEGCAFDAGRLPKASSLVDDASQIKGTMQWLMIFYRSAM